jgi:DNA-binding NtrC family response regulator
MDHPKMREEPRFRVLIVDDEPTFVTDLAAFLSKMYEVGVAYDGRTALEQVAVQNPDVVLLDIMMKGAEEGFDTLKKIRKMDPPPEVIMLTELRETDAVVRAIKTGAFHYVPKPPVMSELINLVNHAASRSWGARRLAALKSQVERLGGRLVIADPTMERIMKDLDRVAPTETTVMVIGESGTGKELVAQHVHEMSRRASGPFVAVNCGAISEQLIESELFGHVRGAFTGAEANRIGCFEMAEGGTIFLDEIGHAPRSLQVKLLRVLEEREFQKVGSPTGVRANVRVVAASSRDLQEAVASGDFMEELFFRLNVFRIRLPRLRNRPGDIIPLAEHFIGIYSAQMGRQDLSLTPSAARYLMDHDWRGNVRELRNLIERAVIMAEGDEISLRVLAEDHRDWPAVMPQYEEAKSEVMGQFKKSYIARILKDVDGNVTEAARRSGLARSALSRMIGELGLR